MTDTKLNIYQKLQKVRIDLQSLNLKKTGQNDYSKFTYYELGDILPTINKLMNDNGLMTEFSINPKILDSDEGAKLRIINTDSPNEVIRFTSPTAEAKIGVKKDGTGGADPIQNLGGKITYMRRYMLMIAFEIVESDWVEQQKQKVEDANSLELPLEDIKTLQSITDKKQLLDESTKILTRIGNKYKKSLNRYYRNRRLQLDKGSTE